jgi:uncharacterized membrane protein
VKRHPSVANPAALCAAVIRAAALCAAVIRAAVIRAAVIRAAVIRAAVIRAAVIRAAVIRAAVIRAAVIRAAVYAVVVSALTACGGDSAPDDGSSTCPSDLPTDTDCAAGVAPKYGAVIAGIVEQRCRGCHYPQNPFSSQVFGDYEQLFAARRTALSRVYGCLMPPSEATPLRPEERGALLKWFVCGAPQN